jgi:hypothetical protein
MTSGFDIQLCASGRARVSEFPVAGGAEVDGTATAVADRRVRPVARWAGRRSGTQGPFCGPCCYRCFLDSVGAAVVGPETGL